MALNLGRGVATIEERLRLYGSKTRCFCPQNKWQNKWGQAPFCKKEDIFNLKT